MYHTSGGWLSVTHKRRSGAAEAHRHSAAPSPHSSLLPQRSLPTRAQHVHSVCHLRRTPPPPHCCTCPLLHPPCNAQRRTGADSTPLAPPAVAMSASSDGVASQPRAASLFASPAHCQSARHFLSSVSPRCSLSTAPPLFYPPLLSEPSPPPAVACHFLRHIALQPPFSSDPTLHLRALRRFYTARLEQAKRAGAGIGSGIDEAAAQCERAAGALDSGVGSDGSAGSLVGAQQQPVATEWSTGRSDAAASALPAAARPIDATPLPFPSAAAAAKRVSDEARSALLQHSHAPSSSAHTTSAAQSALSASHSPFLLPQPHAHSASYLPHSPALHFDNVASAPLPPPPTTLSFRRARAFPTNSAAGIAAAAKGEQAADDEALAGQAQQQPADGDEQLLHHNTATLDSAGKRSSSRLLSGRSVASSEQWEREAVSQQYYRPLALVHSPVPASHSVWRTAAHRSALTHRIVCLPLLLCHFALGSRCASSRAASQGLGCGSPHPKYAHTTLNPAVEHLRVLVASGCGDLHRHAMTQRLDALPSKTVDRSPPCHCPVTPSAGVVCCGVAHVCRGRALRCWWHHSCRFDLTDSRGRYEDTSVSASTQHGFSSNHGTSTLVERLSHDYMQLCVRCFSVACMAMLCALARLQASAGSSLSSSESRGSSLPDLSAALRPTRHGTSYAHLLASARHAQQQQQYDGGEAEQQAEGGAEEWQQLDDPNLQSAKHRVVLPLPGLMSSVIPFVRGKELKQQLNAQFRQKVGVAV